MRMVPAIHRFLLVAALAAVCGAAAAGERCDLVFANRLDEEVVYSRVKYSTPYDEPRFSRSRIALQSGGDYRIGVQGVTLPEQIIIDLASKSFVFPDLSGLDPANYMALEIVHEDGRPLLRRTDADGEAEGIERDYLTAANYPNTVNAEDVMHAETMEEALEAVRERTRKALAAVGPAEGPFPVEAGPVWNQEHAEARCPEAVGEWESAHGRRARWNGQWRTTVPGEMSVCDCIAGTADEEGTIVFEDDGWGKMAYFPAFWVDWFGTGFVSDNVAGDKAAVGVRLRVSADDAAEMMDELLSDLRFKKYRPARFSLETWGAESEGESGGREELFVDFYGEDGDTHDAHGQIVAALAVAYEKPMLTGVLALVEDEAFEKVKAGAAEEDIPATRGVLCYFSKGVFEAFFLPDGRIFL